VGGYRRYDLVKELVVAVVVVALLTVGLAVVFSSPDEKPVTIAQWAQADPKDFLATAVAELEGTSGAAQYGPPYTHVAGAGQKLGPISLERLAGVRHPVDTTNDFVARPLSEAAPGPAVMGALSQYLAAPADRQHAWADAYVKALDQASFSGSGEAPQLPPGDYGPVPAIMAELLALARSGGLEGALLSTGGFYQTDYTKPLLFLADGSYLSGKAQDEHLVGSEWGMTNETGSFPGQAWLWAYTFWYQVPPFTHTANADVEIWAIMAVLTLGLVLLPWIPGLRSIPRAVPVYRIIWRDYYRRFGGLRKSPTLRESPDPGAVS
jgi:hypothetical protein